MSVSAAELPELSRESGNVQGAEERLRKRLDAGLRRIAFFVVPSAVAFFMLGDVVGGLLVQTGRFGAAQTRELWYLLMGSAVGLLAGTLARLYASAFYALHDARTPLRFATVRVLVAACLAYLAVRHLAHWLGAPALLGCAGITAASGVAAWLEFLLLRRALRHRIGPTGVGARRLMRLWALGSGGRRRGGGSESTLGARLRALCGRARLLGRPASPGAGASPRADGGPPAAPLWRHLPCPHAGTRRLRGVRCLRPAPAPLSAGAGGPRAQIRPKALDGSAGARGGAST